MQIMAVEKEVIQIPSTNINSFLAHNCGKNSNMNKNRLVY